VSSTEVTGTISTKVPARLDRLPWSRWHWMIVIGLGTVWILDGLEVTIVGNISGQLGMPGSGLHITQGQVTGFGAATYVAGACVGALFFGWLTDRFGRKKLFMITLGVYLTATALTALSFAPWWFFLFRFMTGFGIGGEYAAINSAIDELIPSRQRGMIDIIINGTYWAGAAAGALLTVPATNDLPVGAGWRLCVGVVLGLVVVLFFASAGASSAYLTVSEVFHAGDQSTGHRVLLCDRYRRGRHQRPADLLLPGEHGKVSDTVVAFSIGAILMIGGGVAELFLGVKAERQSLESIAQPLTAEDAEDASGRGDGHGRGELQTV
jgi:MFS family permease